MARSAASLLGVVALLGCAAGDSPGDDDDTHVPVVCDVTVGPAPVRRLTRVEYDNTVRDLLDDETAPARAFPPDENTFGFAVGGAVSVLHAEQIMDAAETLSEAANPYGLVYPPCSPATDGEETCANRLIEEFGKKAYRRPLAPDEIGRLQTLWAFGRDTHDNLTGMRLVLQAMLQSPNFLYRVELGMPGAGEGDLVPLSSWEIATRLSYLFWQTTPDEELLAAAEAGELATPEQIEAQARRMLDDPRAREAVEIFHVQWLGLEALDGIEKDSYLFPGFTDAAADAMRDETLAFVEHVLFEEDGTLETLLTAPYSFVNRDLAPIYGVSVAAETVVQTDLDPDQRSGLLTHASILSIYSKPNQNSPIHRGKFVRERLLCQTPPPPPPGMAATAPEVVDGVSTRERFEQHRADATCAACHDLMDPIGLGFEHYDTIGQYRTNDGGDPVDATGEIIEGGDASGTFEGVGELAERLSESEAVSECLATQWFRYTYGRREGLDDECTIAKAWDGMLAADGDVKELVVALTQSEAFRYRRAIEEVSP